jgi:hypothetical protein
MPNIARRDRGLLGTLALAFTTRLGAANALKGAFAGAFQKL